MKNADVEPGQTYVWARHKPTLGSKGTKVTALAVEMIRVEGDSPRSPGRRLTMVRVRWEEDRRSSFGDRVQVAAGTESHVPARELHGDYETWSAVVDGYHSRKDEGARLQTEIQESLIALGLDPETTHVWPRVGVALTIQVDVRGAEDAQRLSDALSFAHAAKD